MHGDGARAIQIVQQGCELVQRLEVRARDVAVVPFGRASHVDYLDGIQHAAELLRGDLPDLRYGATLAHPLREAALQSAGDMFDPDAGQPHARFFEMLGVFGDQDDIAIEP
jgi:hypothetical protein